MAPSSGPWQDEEAWLVLDEDVAVCAPPASLQTLPASKKPLPVQTAKPSPTGPGPGWTSPTAATGATSAMASALKVVKVDARPTFQEKQLGPKLEDGVGRTRGCRYADWLSIAPPCSPAEERVEASKARTQTTISSDEDDDEPAKEPRSNMERRLDPLRHFKTEDSVQSASSSAPPPQKNGETWGRSKAALNAALRYLGLGGSARSSEMLAMELFDFALSVLTATAPEIAMFVDSLTADDRKALERLCASARKGGLLGKPAPSFSLPAPIEELTQAFLVQPRHVRTSHSDLSLSSSNLSASRGLGGLGPGTATIGGSSTRLLRSGSNLPGSAAGRSTSTLGAPRGSLGAFARSFSDMSSTSFTDFNKRHNSKSQHANDRTGSPGSTGSGPAANPSFLEFLFSLSQQSGKESPMPNRLQTVEEAEGGVTMVMDLKVPLRQGPSTILETVSEAGMSYHSAFDAVIGGEGEEKEVVQAELLNIGGDGGNAGNVRIAFKSKCLRTQNEWQRKLLAQQSVLIQMVSSKLKVAEQTVKTGDELGNEQRELLRGFRKIITREIVEDEGASRVSVFIVEKNDELRGETEELCKILEYPCQAFRGLKTAQKAISDAGSDRSLGRIDSNTVTGPVPDNRRNSRESDGSGSIGPLLLEGRPGAWSQDWRSRALLPSAGSRFGNKVPGPMGPLGVAGGGSRSGNKLGAAPSTSDDLVRVVLIGAAWLDKELPAEWQTSGVFVVLMSEAEEFEEVGRTLLASGEAEIRERLRVRGISEYLMHPLSLESVRGVVGQALRWRFGDEYLLLQAVGRGTSGVVHRAKRLRDGGAFALKEINTKRLTKSAKMDVEREFKLLQELRWPTIVFLVDTWENNTDRLRYLLMPLLEGGSLLQRTEVAIRDGGEARASGERIAEWYAQSMHGLTYLHWRGVLHRDLKPGNLLLAADDRTLQIADLGSAVLLPGYGPHPARMNTIKGAVCTPLYAAPETLLEEIFSSGSDIWSIGATFYEVVTLKPLFESGIAMPELQASVRQFDVRAGPWQAALNEAKVTTPPVPELADLLQRDHLKRSTASDLVARAATLKRLRAVLGEVGALPTSEERKSHFDDFERIRRESDAAATTGTPGGNARAQGGAGAVRRP